jgi:hypothetical protein
LKENLDNVYALEFPKGLDISPTFKLANFYEYHEGVVGEDEKIVQ